MDSDTDDAAVLMGILTPYSDDGVDAYEVSTMVNYARNVGRKSLHGWGKRSHVMGYPTGTFAVHNGHTKLRRSRAMNLRGVHG